MLNNCSEVNKIIVLAQKKVAEAKGQIGEKVVEQINASATVPIIDNELLTNERNQLSVNLDNGSNIREIADKVIQSSCDKMVDEAVAKARLKTYASEQELEEAIKAIIRGHRTTFFKSQPLLDEMSSSAQKHIEWMIEKQIKDAFNDKIINNALRPLDKLIFNSNQQINTVFAKALRFDLEKELNEQIESVLKDPTRKIESKLNKLGLYGFSDFLTKELRTFTGSLSGDISKGINEDLFKQQEQIKLVQKEIIEVQKQIAEYRKIVNEEINKLRDMAMKELKKLEQQAINEISKVIKLNIRW